MENENRYRSTVLRLRLQFALYPSPTPNRRVYITISAHGQTRHTRVGPTPDRGGDRSTRTGHSIRKAAGEFHKPRTTIACAPNNPRSAFIQYPLKKKGRTMAASWVASA